MQLLDHVSIGVPDLDIARRFYDAIMSALGAAKVYDLPHALGYGERCTPQDAASTYLAVYLDQGAEFLVLANRSRYPRSAFFDTPSHLNEPAQIAHSALLARALAQRLDRPMRATALAQAPHW